MQVHGFCACDANHGHDRADSQSHVAHQSHSLPSTPRSAGKETEDFNPPCAPTGEMEGIGHGHADNPSQEARSRPDGGKGLSVAPAVTAAEAC